MTIEKTDLMAFVLKEMAPVINDVPNCEINHELSSTYKTDPSPEMYLRLRREHPDQWIDFEILGSERELHTLEEDYLLRFNIEPNWVRWASGGSQNSISLL